MAILIKRLLMVAVSLVAAACGGSGGGDGGPAPSPIPNNPNRIVIQAGGVVSPKDITVPIGSRVLFINNDSRRHDMTSDEHPNHLDCPDINTVGVLLAGQFRETSNLTDARTCGYHDHENPDDINLKGRIIVR
jgi:hypothetical protein